MDYNMLIMTEAMNDVQTAFERLDDQMRTSEEVAGVMESLEQLYTEVKTLGYCPEVKDKILHFEALESYTKLSAEKVVKYTATESIAEATKDAAKKFWEAIKLAFQKIADFFSQVFNTFDNKCRQILLHINAIDLEKEVMTLTKEKFAKLLVTGKDVQEFSEKTFQRTGNFVQYQSNYAAAIQRFAMNHAGVLKADGGMSGHEFSIDPKGVEFENKTLKDAGYSITDCKTMTSMFQTRTKNYSTLKAVFMTIIKQCESEDANHFDGDRDAKQSVRLAIRTQGFVYRLLAKIQSVACKEIVAFYKCIGNSVSVNPDYQAPNQIGYAG